MLDVYFYEEKIMDLEEELRRVAQEVTKIKLELEIEPTPIAQGVAEAAAVIGYRLPVIAERKQAHEKAISTLEVLEAKAEDLKGLLGMGATVYDMSGFNYRLYCFNRQRREAYGDDMYFWNLRLSDFDEPIPDEVLLSVAKIVKTIGGGINQVRALGRDGHPKEATRFLSWNRKGTDFIVAYWTP